MSDSPPNGVTTDASSAAPDAVSLSGITKRFPGVVANDRITFKVRPGEIHALVGENGAGKSTLMKILYGMQKPDEGTIEVKGEEVHFRSPKDAIAAGIGMVHQHFMLAGRLTVLENIILGEEPGRFGAIDFKAARESIQRLILGQGVPLNLNRPVETLSVGEKQRVEILKVLYRGADLLILDEPTGVLVPQEVDELFDTLRDLAANGVTIIFISHKLDEVLQIADSVTVVRLGRTVTSVPAAELTSRQLAELMVGSELPTPDTRAATDVGEVRLAVDGLGVRDPESDRMLLDDVGFEIRSGEVMGIAGVEGNGQAELIEALLGLRDPDLGSILLGERDITHLPTRQRREAGVGYIPEDRHYRGLLLSAPLWENVMLGHQSSEPFLRHGLINREGARTQTQEVIDGFDVRTPGVDVTGNALSGGNQQKLIVGRELNAKPRVLIAAHPTRGVDVGAQAAVWEEIRAARDRGLAVLLLSADLDELIGLSDRLTVILRGRLVADLDPQQVTPEELGSYMTGATEEADA